MTEKLVVDPNLLTTARQLAGNDDNNVMVAEALRE